MKANELRIGNWIKSIAGKETVIDVMCDSINTQTLEAIQYEYVEPIPLTEEWLLKFGFKKPDDKNLQVGWSKEGFVKKPRLVIYKFFSDEELESPFLRFDGLVDVHFVHQLQNLYFDLTGEELKIKVPA